MVEKMQKQACSTRRYEIKRSALPLSCPREDMRLWDAHPKVFLPIETTGQAICPYCGTVFVLTHD